MSCRVGRRFDLDLVLLWLWCRPVATAPIWPLTWEPPYAAGATLKRKKEKKKNTKKQLLELSLWLSGLWTQLVSMRMWVWSLALRGGLRIQRCYKLWCRSQLGLGSCIAVAAAPIWLLAWELPYASSVALKKPKKHLSTTIAHWR